MFVRIVPTSILHRRPQVLGSIGATTIVTRGEPVFNGEGFDAFGAPPSKDFSNAGDASLTWAELEHTFGITKALYEAAKLLEEDNLYALKAAYAARGVSAESYAVDFSEP